MVRTLIALLLMSGLANANVARVRWRGVEAQSGTAPARLEAATSSHLALALRPLGAALVPGPPFDAEAVARCAFSVARRAQCQVLIVAGELRAERRSDVPYRDADDLAESIALLIASMLQTDFADLPAEPEPEPEPPKPPPPRVQPPPPPETRPPTKTETETRPPTKTETETRPEAKTPTATATAKRTPKLPDSFLLSAGPSVAVGFVGDPTLFGASVRALYLARRVLRVGGTVTLEGADVTRGGYALSFFRLVAAPRLGVGLTYGRVDVDLSAGPALHLLYGSASGASHTLSSFAAVAGVRLGVTITDGLALELGLDVLASLHDEKVVAGPTQVSGFGRWWLDLALALVYRR